MTAELTEELTGILILERLALIAKDSEIDSAIHQARLVATNLTRRTFKDEKQATKYLQRQIQLVQARLSRSR